MSESERHEHRGRRVEKEIRIDVPPQTLWDAWAEPEKIAQWFVDRAEGKAAPGEVMTWEFDSFGKQPVPIVEAERPSRLAIGGEIPGRPPFLMTIEIRRDEGTTVMRLVNSGFGDGAEWDEEYEGIDSGWAMALATLSHWIEIGGPTPRLHRMAMRPASFDFDRVQTLFTTQEGLRRWLGDDATVGSEPEALSTGTTISFTLPEGDRLQGKVLCRTRREVLFSWPEETAVVGLKCFTKGEQSFLCLDLSTWKSTEERVNEVASRLQDALGRLAEAAM